MSVKQQCQVNLYLVRNSWSKFAFNRKGNRFLGVKILIIVLPKHEHCGRSNGGTSKGSIAAEELKWPHRDVPILNQVT